MSTDKFTIAEAVHIIWRAQEVLRRIPLVGAFEFFLPDDLFQVQERLRSGAWNEDNLKEWAYTFIPRGRRGRVFIALTTPLTVRVHGFVRWVLLSISVHS